MAEGECVQLRLITLLHTANCDKKRSSHSLSSPDTVEANIHVGPYSVYQGLIAIGPHTVYQGLIAIGPHTVYQGLIAIGPHTSYQGLIVIS